jgi:hypothetical protein
MIRRRLPPDMPDDLPPVLFIAGPPKRSRRLRRALLALTVIVSATGAYLLLRPRSDPETALAFGPLEAGDHIETSMPPPRPPPAPEPLAEPADPPAAGRQALEDDSTADSIPAEAQPQNEPEPDPPRAEQTTPPPPPPDPPPAAPRRTESEARTRAARSRQPPRDAEPRRSTAAEPDTAPRSITAPESSMIEPPPSTPGRLFVSSRPWGALYLNGRLLGNTPLAGIVVPAGVHRLRIERPGYRPYERMIEMPPGGDVRLIDILLETP